MCPRQHEERKYEEKADRVEAEQVPVGQESGHGRGIELPVAMEEHDGERSDSAQRIERSLTHMTPHRVTPLDDRGDCLIPATADPRNATPTNGRHAASAGRSMRIAARGA